MKYTNTTMTLEEEDIDALLLLFERPTYVYTMKYLRKALGELDYDEYSCAGFILRQAPLRSLVVPNDCDGAFDTPAVGLTSQGKARWIKLHPDYKPPKPGFFHRLLHKKVD